MCERIGIVDVCRELALVLPCIVTEHIFISVLTCAENYDLNSVAADFINYSCDKVKALLVCETGYDTDHHNVGVNLESKLSLKVELILNLFLLEVLGCELMSDIDVCLGVELVVVDTVYDTCKNVGACTEKSVKLFAVEACLDLFSVCFTYSCNAVSIYDTALEKVYVLVRLKLIG